MALIKRISNYFYSVSTGWVALAALVVFTLFMIFVLPQQAKKADAYSGGRTPDTSYIYTADDLYQMAQDYGADGRAAYIRARFTFDLVFPLVYLFFLTATVSWSLGRTLPERSPWRLLNLIPLAGAIFDYLENISASLVIARYPATTPVVDILAPIFTAIKWIFVDGSFVLLICALLFVLWIRFSKRTERGD